MKTNRGQSMEIKTCDNCIHRGFVKKGTPDETEVCFLSERSTSAESFHLIPMDRTCQDWKGHNLPIPTTGSNINNLLDWLKNGLAEKQYGELGLILTVHDSQIVKWQKIETTVEKNVTSCITEKDLAEMTVKQLDKAKRGY